MIVSAIFWFAIVGKLLIGYLSDHFDKILIMFIMVIALIVGLTILRFSRADNFWDILLCGSLRHWLQWHLHHDTAGHCGILFRRVLWKDSWHINHGGCWSRRHCDYGNRTMQGAFNSYLPVFEMLIGLACMVALLVLFLFKMRRNILQKAQPALS